MALRNRIYFFDPLNTDRFNSRDIPTEQTMLDWSDSVPFIKEPNDKSQLTRAGIAKTTSDAKINNGDNTDAAGVSPIGFTTFVRPAQLPVMIDSASIIWNKVSRGGSTSGDTGAGIEDWQAEVIFPPDVPPNATEVDTTVDVTVNLPDGSLCDPLSILPVNYPAGTNTQQLMIAMNNAISLLSNKVVELAQRVCESSNTEVAVGDVVMTVTNPGAWGSNWIEPKGQSLLRADYPELFGVFGTTYGSVDINHFNIPDMVTGQNYLRVKEAVGLIPSGDLTDGVLNRTLTDNDMPDHSHTVTGTTSIEQHEHILPVYNDDVGNLPVIDGNAGQNGFLNYTTPLGGDHSHTLTGTTNTYGNVAPDPVWDMNTSVTPRHQNVHLKMRIK